METSNNKQSAFTIVELLVVIVVIGILAAITIISYTGISNKAIVATLRADLSSASRQLKIFKTIDSNEYYPTTISCAIPDSTINKCIKPSGDSYYSLYTPNNTTNPRTFILEETNGTITYRITDDSTPVVVIPTPVTAIAAITGTTIVGNVLTAGALTPSGATVTYQWQSATTAGGTYTNIASATASTYTLVSGDWAKYIKVVATATGSYSGTQTSAASSVVMTPITNIAAITGTTIVGNVLTAGALTPSGATVTYQWQSATTAGGTYTDISSATASTYTLVSGNVDKYIKVVATATDSYTGTQTSTASTVVSDPWSNWYSGIAATALDGKHVYKTDLGSTYYYKTTNDAVASPQGSTGLDPNYPSNMSLVSPQTNPGVDFSAYPAQNACKAIGGRLPNMQELLAIYAGRATYGNNFPAGYYYYRSSTEYNSNGSYGVGFYAGSTEFLLKADSRYVRCVSG